MKRFFIIPLLLLPILSWAGECKDICKPPMQLAWNPAIQAVVSSGGEAAGYAYTSTHFSGSSRMYQSSNLTGISDNKTFTLSVWVKLSDQNGAYRFLLSAYDGGTNRRVAIYIDNSDVLHIILRNASSVTIYEGYTTGTFTTTSGWFHIMASVNLATAAYHLYIDGVSDINVASGTDDTIDYSMAGASPQWDIDGTEDNSYQFHGLISEFYMTNEYIDLSDAANRAKFRTTGGKPENLGTNCATPTGTQPLICLRNTYDTFGTNVGSGGNFSVNGDALTDGGADKP